MAFRKNICCLALLATLAICASARRPSAATGFVLPTASHASLWTKSAMRPSASYLRVAETQEQEKQQPLYPRNTKSSRRSSNLIPVPTQNLGPQSGGMEKKLGDSLIKGFKKASAVGLAVVLSGIILVGSMPVVSHAASASLAELTAGASSSYNSVVAKLAASGFLQAFSLVFVSEIGDKTFFIAGLLAMKTSRLISFTGSMAALSVMTIISVLIGQVFHAIPSGLAGGFKFDQWVAVLAFSYFGLKTLKDSYEMADGDSSGMDEERSEAEKAVEESSAPEQRTPWGTILQIFSLVFAAEFGDRSFLSTIALGAAQNPFSVATGAIGAHATATGIAVVSGAFLSKYFSEKVIGFVGGSLFVIFAVTTALGIF